MSELETTLVDMRWTEPGWRDVFMPRLVGWMPRENLAGPDADNLFSEDGEKGDQFALTDQAKSWTDPHPEIEELTHVYLAEMLVCTDLDPMWFDVIPSNALFIREEDRFDEEFREKLLRYFVLAALKS